MFPQSAPGGGKRVTRPPHPPHPYNYGDTLRLPRSLQPKILLFSRASHSTHSDERNRTQLIQNKQSVSRSLDTLVKARCGKFRARVRRVRATRGSTELIMLSLFVVIPTERSDEGSLLAVASGYLWWAASSRRAKITTGIRPIMMNRRALRGLGMRLVCQSRNWGRSGSAISS